jgi:GNAT superfamily N-acetyltransferase
MAFHQNWIGVFETLPKYLPMARFWRSGNIAIATTGWPASVFNGVLLSECDGLTADLIEMLSEPFSRTTLPYSFQFYSPTQQADCEELFWRAGYGELIRDPLMDCIGPLESLPANPTIRIEPVLTDSDRALYVQTVLEGFGMSGQNSQDVIGVMATMQEGYHVTAWLHQTLVGAGTVLFCGGVAGIYNVTTLPFARRQGVAVRIMEALHGHALAQGYSGTSLASSVMGSPLYRRLGYQPAGYQIAYVPLNSE